MVEPAPESQAETQEVGGGRGITLSPQPEQSANTEPGTESTMPQPQQSKTSEPASADQVSQSELEFIVPKPRYDCVRHAMDDSENLIYITFDKSGTFMRARPDTFDS